MVDSEPGQGTTSHPNAALIGKLYQCFRLRDGAGMAACYHPAATFSDPVFTDLHGPEVGAMWTMLCERAKDFDLAVSGIRADGERGAAHWEADYTFSATGRRVHNVIEADFRFRDGLIVRHEDTFSLWKWSAMALGPVGVLFGWFPPVRAAIRRKAAAGLEQYRQRRG